MNRRRLPRIQLDEKHLPYRWQEKLIVNQEAGGVFLVFLSGKTTGEIDIKVKSIKQFCKTLSGSCKRFAQVRPLLWEGTLGGDTHNPFPLKKAGTP